MQRTTAVSAAKSTRELIEREAHRDFRKIGDRPQPDHAAAGAVSLNVGIALGGELLDGGVKGVHLIHEVLQNYPRHREYHDGND